MESKKNKKESTVVIVLLILLVLGLGGFIVYDKVLSENSKTNKIEVNSKTKKEKVEKLDNIDITSRLVQTLYNKVVDREGPNMYWMYINNDNYIVSEQEEATKMNLVGINLSESKKIYLTCDEKIPDTVTINEYEQKSVCFANRKSKNPDSQYGYKRSYVETVYQSLYGKDAKLDTSVPIRNSVYTIDYYVYVKDLDMYVQYVSIGGGTSAVTYKGELTKTVRKGKNLVLYEKSIMTNPEATEESTYAYTFELEDDGMYKFISRVKEK